MYKGNLSKLYTENTNPVTYKLQLDDQEIILNDFIGKELSIDFGGRINCIACGKKTNKSFAQGFCYACFQTSPLTEECILRPELCRAQLGEGRDVDWAKEQHLQPHFVYLAYSSNVKVGVTRSTQVPTRWIDQGASEAIPFLKTPNRHIAGVAEVFLKQKYADKTNWKKMLTQSALMMPDLKAEAKDAFDFLPPELKKYAYQSDVFQITYPYEQYATDIKSVNLEKQTRFNGRLVGIKGQYLILDSGEVLNVRRHNGYYVELSLGS